MSEPTDDLEAMIRRKERPASDGSWPMADPLAIGQCDCGARITVNDVYGQSGEVDLGRPARRAPRRASLPLPLPALRPDRRAARRRSALARKARKTTGRGRAEAAPRGTPAKSGHGI